MISQHSEQVRGACSRRTRGLKWSGKRGRPSATQLAKVLHPDVVLMDVYISPVDGVTVTRQIKALLPRTEIIGLSAIPTPNVVAAMRQAGARGFIPKGQIYEQLLPAIQEAIGGPSSSPH